jgi:hypothetical protein
MEPISLILAALAAGAVAAAKDTAGTAVGASHLCNEHKYLVEK